MLFVYLVRIKTKLIIDIQHYKVKHPEQFSSVTNMQMIKAGARLRSTTNDAKLKAN